MKKFRTLALLACGVLIASCSGYAEDDKKTEADTVPETKLSKQDVSYALGYNIGQVLVKTDDKLMPDEIAKGLKDSFTKSSSPRFKEDEIKNILMMYNIEISNSMKEKQEQTRLENIDKGKAFVAEYEKKAGVKKDSSGYLYKVIHEGHGPMPKGDDKVTVEYVGKKIDGKVFFSTKDQGSHADFVVNNLIKGLVTALQKMPVGSTWEIVLPPELAYGDTGAPDAIAPGETLIFEIHLVDIKNKDKDKEVEHEETP